MLNGNTLLFIFLIIIVVVLIIVYTKSPFENIKSLLNDNYNSRCTVENRQYPQGNVPGSYLGLSDAEKNNLKLFINNSSVI